MVSAETERRVPENERQRSCHLLYLSLNTHLFLSCPPSPSPSSNQNGPCLCMTFAV